MSTPFRLIYGLESTFRAPGISSIVLRSPIAGTAGIPLRNPTPSRLGIVVNPMSGRDVRRVAARASTSAHLDKENIVARLVVGALSQGVREIYVAKEPFRISTRAVENLPHQDRIHTIEVPITHTDADTQAVAERMWQAGCRTFIVLGGDGTNRIVAHTLPNAALLPVSTGTNNVFPESVDASVAGAAAGLIAAGKVDLEAHCLRCKQIHIKLGSNDKPKKMADTALIDAVLLRGDDIGSLLPFRPEHIRTVLLTRAEPASIGVSPIGGYLMPCDHGSDFGVAVRCGEPAKHRLTIPISPGLYGQISVSAVEPVPMGSETEIRGPGVLALDGDRVMNLGAADRVVAVLRRDGPYVIEAGNIMGVAAEKGVLDLIRDS